MGCGIEELGQDRVAAFKRETKDAVVSTPSLIPQGVLAGSSLWRHASSFLGLTHL